MDYYNEAKRQYYDEPRRDRINELKEVINLHEQFYLEKFDDCLRNCRKKQNDCQNKNNDSRHCMEQYSRDYEEMVSPYKRRLHDLKN